MAIINRIKHTIKSFVYTSIIILYRLTIEKKIRSIRNKDKIKVLFVLSDLSKWKTELLYKGMLSHSRFIPILGIALKTDEAPSESVKKFNNIIQYLSNNNYDYIELLYSGYINKIIKPDIIIYQEPYESSLLPHHSFLYNLNALFISITYGFHSVLMGFNNLIALKRIAWFDCYENESTASDAMKYANGRRSNIQVTGLPMAEALLKYQQTDSVWKAQKRSKKRVIWAPHHSIGAEFETIKYGTFLIIAEAMLDLALKYKDSVQWAFKPHPLLKNKLVAIWGVGKTEEYYRFWAENEFTQLEEASYIDLFFQSDALIHDCDTFSIEYLYTKKPAIFISANKKPPININTFAQEAYSLHYYAQNINEIEQLLCNIIKNIDPYKNDRIVFYNNKLNIETDRNASSNIIKHILNHNKNRL